MTGAFGDGVRLTFVFGDVVVDVADNVRADGGFHDVGERSGWGGVGNHISFQGLDINEWTNCCCGHFLVKGRGVEVWRPRVLGK